MLVTKVIFWGGGAIYSDSWFNHTLCRNVFLHTSQKLLFARIQFCTVTPLSATMQKFLPAKISDKLFVSINVK